MEALEKELYIDINEKSNERIIDIFELAMSIQLPVIDNKKIVGILDLYKFLRHINKPFSIEAIMNKDFTIAGDKKGKFTFSSSNQVILPFINKAGEYIGFVDRMLQKCYLPSKEYMRVVEGKIDQSKRDDDLGGLTPEEFDAIFESNYDGIYITVKEGETLGINNKCEYIAGINESEIYLDNDKGEVIIEANPEKATVVSVAQNIQKRNEISVTSGVVPDGSLIRVIQNMKDFDKMRNELAEIKILAEKYQTELDYFKWNADHLAPEIIAKSQAMKKVVNLALKIAKADSTVLIQGQSGVGKGLLSKMIHDNSTRCNASFVKIDCGAIPENLLESELFGYESGAFTGADKKGKIGHVELANGGTLFLDEIGEVPLSLQTKLLRLLQDKEIIRIGGKSPISIDARVIAATNRHLEEMVAQKLFRKDLYYRLNVVPINVPPLKERKEDIIPLVENLLKRFNAHYGSNYNIEPSAMKKLVQYDWPGNIRELENTVEYTLVTCNTETITKEDLPDQVLGSSERIILEGLDEIESLKDAIDNYEYQILVNTMRRACNIQEMADILKLDRSNVSRKIQKYGIKPDFNNNSK